MQPPKIAILMATYNGEKFIAEQLDSFIKQTYTNWYLYVLDDGSKDTTWSILQDYQRRLGAEKLQLFKQPNQGVAKTFLSLLCNPDISADYYAYSDQDDIWDADKLERAVNVLQKNVATTPMLYCTGARLINEKNEHIGYLPTKKRNFGLQNALVQCIATGNTMVFNQTAGNIVKTAGVVAFPGHHDWWTYLAIAACGGEFFYDPAPSIAYRMHSNNVVGFTHNVFVKNYKRLKEVLQQKFKHANQYHIDALLKMQDKMSPSAKNTLHLFIESRKGNVLHQLYYLYKAGVYRQEILGTLALYVAVLLRAF